MIRTVWLAAFCLACLGGLCASKVTASISPPDDGIADIATATSADASGTLTPADRMDLTGFRPTTEVSSARPVDPVIIHPVRANRFFAQGLPRRSNPKAKEVAELTKPHAKSRLNRNGKPQNLTGDLKKCPETNALGALIMSLTGSSHCG